MNRSVTAKNTQEKNLVLCALRGLFSAVITLLILAAVASAVGLLMDDPGKYTKIFAFASLFCGAFSGGFATARRKGSATLFCGLLTGTFLVAALALLALCFALSVNIPLFCVCALSVLLCSVLGANIGVGTQTRAKKKKKR